MGTITLKATSKSGREFRKNVVMVGATEKAISFETFESNRNYNKYGKGCNNSLQFLPKSQIQKTEDGEKRVELTIPMWLFGKLFFENNA